jgi:bacteriochlorophyll 4-vinyl reductase
MNEAGIGRILPASLHQGIADLLPSRLEFYEEWLNPKAMHDGRIGLAPLAGVLSFLKAEGDAYRLVCARAGEYTAEWTFAEMPSARRSLMLAAPVWLRLRLVAHAARDMTARTARGCRATVRWKKRTGSVVLTGSLFCVVRERSHEPLCEYYASAIRRLMQLSGLDAEAAIDQCRAMGGDRCVTTLTVHVR